MKNVRILKDADAVYDLDAKELIEPHLFWSLSKQKYLREDSSGHKCVYVSLWSDIGAKPLKKEGATPEMRP
jgi:hypothetical protein